jgi:hypothetical protein
MALVDPIGPGPTPLYDPAYANEVRDAKEQAGEGPSLLDERLAYFRGAFWRDPAFEVLHFLPLYFPQAGRTEVFSTLQLLAGTEEGIPRAPSARASFGMAAVGSVLTTPDQRRVLGEFVQALDEEWSGFFRGWWQGGMAAKDAVLAALRVTWRDEYGPSLSPFLANAGMTGGMVALVPAIGPEGRIFGGSPQNSGDNGLVVLAPTGPEHGLDAVFSMLRELSFPLVRRVMDRAGATAGNKAENETVATRAAIRSGALVLEAYRPEDLSAYQQFFLSQTGRSEPEGAASGAAFEEAFPLEPALVEALHEEILSTKKDGGVG